MKAILRPVYGKADVLQLGDIEKPAPAGDQLLVKVRAASINPFDWHMMRGTPYLVKIVAGFPKPKSLQLGGDFAGTVEAVGPRVTRFKPGDDVFGVSRASYAEYLTVAEPKNVARKPAALTFEQAAALPIAGLTALQALRDRGRVQPGCHVLINGASGGVGAFAVQIAKSLGAEVAAVCSTPNVELLRSLGASRVFDYKKEDFAAAGRQYDVALDNVGNRPLSDYRRVLKHRGIFVGNGGGGPDDMIWGFGFAASLIRSLAMSLFGSQKFIGVFANVNEKDLIALADLVASGKITPFIERRYSLAETPEAIRHVESMRARGKVIIVL